MSPSLWEGVAERLLTWRGKHFASNTWRQRLKRVGWMTPLSGRISSASTRAGGLGQWISSLADTPASHSVTQGSDSAPTTNGTCGRTSDASSTSQPLLWGSSRTSEDTSLKDSEKFWATSQPMGSMRNGVFSKRPKWEPRTNGRDSSSSRGESELMPTPAASAANDGESPTTWLARAELLKAKHQNGNGAGMPLTVASAMWPTPYADMEQKYLLNSPKDSQAAHRNLSAGARRGEYSHLVPTIPRDGPTTSTQAVLNPQFVETLMGFPLGWTDLGLSATVSSQSKRLWLSEFSSIELD